MNKTIWAIIAAVVIVLSCFWCFTVHAGGKPQREVFYPDSKHGCVIAWTDNGVGVSCFAK